MKISKNRQLGRKRLIAAGAVILLLAAGGTVSALYLTHGKKAVIPANTKPTTNTSQSTKPNTQTVIQGDNAPTGKPGDVTVKKADVVPIISSYSRSSGNMLNVSGLVTGIVDQGGKCTFTLQWDSGSRDATTDAQAGPNSTACGTAQVSLDSIPETADVQIKLTYNSDAYSGNSTNNPSFTVKGLSGE